MVDSPELIVKQSSEVLPRREARMNPEAVQEAKVFTGRVAYFDTERLVHVELPNVMMVEVGKWQGSNNERGPEDYLDTYRSAVSLGLRQQMSWETTGPKDNITYKWLIFAGRDKNNVLLSFSPEDAQFLVNSINAQLIATKERAIDIFTQLAGISE